MAMFDVPEVSWRPADLAWDVREKLPAGDPLLEEIRRNPELTGAWDELRETAVVAATCKPFIAPPFCRPTMHRRSIYLNLGSAGVIAIKGSEPYATDLREEVAHIESKRAPFFNSMLNEFALAEHKLPMGVSLPEAIAEAEMSLAFQRAHWARFGRLARTPMPLMVYRWDSRAERQLFEASEPWLCGVAAEATKRLLSAGIGALVYYYPSLPLRASQQAKEAIALGSSIGGLRLPYGTGSHERAGVAFTTRMRLLRERAEPWEVVASWISLVADMLVVGFFPLHTYFMGHCLQAQNLCIDGGVLDTDSLYPMKGSSDDVFLELFTQSVGELTKGSTVYITGTFVGRYTDQMIGATVWQILHDELRARIDVQPPADGRLARLLQLAPLDRLDHLLEHLLRGEVPANAPSII